MCSVKLGKNNGSEIHVIHGSGTFNVYSYMARKWVQFK